MSLLPSSRRLNYIENERIPQVLQGDPPLAMNRKSYQSTKLGQVGCRECDMNVFVFFGVMKKSLSN
jgi:hypothetical protein